MMRAANPSRLWLPHAALAVCSLLILTLDPAFLRVAIPEIAARPVPLGVSCLLLLPLVWLGVHLRGESAEVRESHTRLALRIAFFLVELLILRSLIFWHYGLPLEKVPILYAVLLQALLCDRAALREYGLSLQGAIRQAGIGLGLLGGMVGYLAVVYFGLSFLLLESPPFRVVPSLPSVGALVFFFLLVAPSEELLFRGWFFLRMRTRLSFWKAALISSLAFGLFHIPWHIQPIYESGWLSSVAIDWSGMALRIVYNAVFGLAMCRIVEFTRNLIPAMIFHALGLSLSGLYPRGLAFSLANEQLFVVSFGLAAVIGLTLGFWKMRVLVGDRG